MSPITIKIQFHPYIKCSKPHAYGCLIRICAPPVCMSHPCEWPTHANFPSVYMSHPPVCPTHANFPSVYMSPPCIGYLYLSVLLVWMSSLCMAHPCEISSYCLCHPCVVPSMVYVFVVSCVCTSTLSPPGVCSLSDV